MADEAQIIYEYTNGNDVEIKTNDLKVSYVRAGVQRTIRPDGNKYTDDPDIPYRIFTGTGVISGTDQDEMDTVQMGTITFDASFPRIKKLFWTGGTTETNIVIELKDFSANDLGFGFWEVSFVMEEYTAA